jgi:hypothetical protein
VNPGAEFTDWQGGHAGVLFADVVELLTPRTVADRDLGLSDLDVLRQAVARGALVVLQLLDREILRRKRRLFPAGGSDSHELYTQATLFVGARARTLETLREGLLTGRV